MTSINLIETLEESESIIDLETRLAQKGRTFRSPGQFSRWLHNEWNKVKRAEIDVVLNAKPQAAVLPQEQIVVGDTKFSLYGIVHGYKLPPLTHLSMSAEVRDWISNQVVQRRSSDIDGMLRMEEGVGKLLNLDPYFDLADMTSNVQKVKPAYNKLQRSAIIAGAVASAPIILGVVYLYSKRALGMTEAIMQSLKDPKYQIKAYDIYNTMCLPQPIGLEMDYVAEINSMSNKIFRKMWGVIIPTSTERSLWTAKQLATISKERGRRDMHYVCGMMHVPEISYFLTHPEYNLDHITEYSKTRWKE